jgi:hypothetical protein
MGCRMISRLRNSAGGPRVVLAGILLALVFALGLHTLTGDQALRFITRAGYWFELFAALILGWALYRTTRMVWMEMNWTKTDLWCGVALVAFGLILIVHEPAGFKILMDEIHLLGTSMAMHVERAAYVPQRAYDLQGIFELMGGLVDKRPLFFPFLVSILHDVTGYRPENPFYLNAFLTWFLLGLSYLGGRALGGWRAGLLAALWWTTLPLLGQNARGGGFELLNIVMILLTALLAGCYYQRRDATSMIAMVYNGLLLAQTRYESPLFLFPVALVLILVWWEEGRLHLPWAVVVAPLFLLPVPLLIRVFQIRPESWEMASKPGTSAVFSITNIPDNMGHALAFWFNTGVEQPNSSVLAGGGLIALAFCLVRLRRWISNWRAEPVAVRTALLFMAALLMHLVLMLCYFWGRFDEPVIRRLSLPAYVLMVFAMILAVRDLPRASRFYQVLMVAAVFALVFSGIPGLARQGATRFYYPALDVAWRREFLKVLPEKDFLMIDNDTSLWITHEVSATPVVRARERPDALGFNLRNRMFSAIYVFQRFDINEQTGQLTVKPEDELGQAFELETVGERTFRIDLLSRISKVRSIRLSAGERVEAAPIASVINVKATERSGREKLLLEQWLKNLP